MGCCVGSTHQIECYLSTLGMAKAFGGLGCSWSTEMLSKTKMGLLFGAWSWWAWARGAEREPRASVTQLLDDDSVLSVCLPRSPQTSPCVCEREKQVFVSGRFLHRLHYAEARWVQFG